MIIKLLTEHYLELLSLQGGSRGSSEATLVKMSNCWKSHAAAQLLYFQYRITRKGVRIFWVKYGSSKESSSNLPSFHVD